MAATVLTITRETPTSELQVSGPLNDPVLCYGLLEAAKDAIRELRHNRGVVNGGIVAAPAEALQRLK